MTRSENKIACPCCGYQTLESRGNYDICRVCWWEDDGQDNFDANVIKGGPNYGLSLLRARFNYLNFGLYDPERKDLLSKKDAPEKYLQIRKFNIEEDGRTIFEIGNGWKANLDEEVDLS